MDDLNSKGQVVFPCLCILSHVEKASLQQEKMKPITENQKLNCELLDQTDSSTAASFLSLCFTRYPSIPELWWLHCFHQ